MFLNFNITTTTFLLQSRAPNHENNQGLGIDRPENLQSDDNEYDAYRKRMMLAYRFRPNPLVSSDSHTTFRYYFFFVFAKLSLFLLQNNPRRPYY